MGWNEKGDLVFQDKKTVQADAVILALGGASWPRLGSDGNWADILRKQGIDVTPMRPSNCGFIAPWSSIFGERFAGEPLKSIIIYFADIRIQGEAMITRGGLEGGVIYALSSKIRDAIEVEGKALLSFDLRPGLSMEELTTRLNAPRGSQSSSTYLRKALGLSPLTISLMRESLKGPLPTHPEVLASLIKNTKIAVTKTSDMARAISTAGGIAREEMTAEFMLKKKPGVFAVGEMLDWEAPTGGYLLQASFSMAFAAAKGARDYVFLAK